MRQFSNSGSPSQAFSLKPTSKWVFWRVECALMGSKFDFIFKISTPYLGQTSCPLIVSAFTKSTTPNTTGQTFAIQSAPGHMMDCGQHFLSCWFLSSSLFWCPSLGALLEVVHVVLARDRFHSPQI